MNFLFFNHFVYFSQNVEYEIANNKKFAQANTNKYKAITYMNAKISNFMYIKFWILFIAACFTNFAQVTYPKDYFRSPLNIPLQLSGNFGELRSNHFHAGFDFKTNQKEGLAVYAVADGYVSRIKISTFGNGKTLYINHPNGFTSVYAHLQKATDSIETYIKQKHYQEKSYEMDFYLKANELEVKKGQIIALAGNSGASEGPHLHFEFRDSFTEKIINPFHFGFDQYIKDTKKPVIYGLHAYPIDKNSIVNQSQQPLLLNLTLQKDGSYRSEQVNASGRIGFGINSYDFDNISYNKNGVYKVQTFLNGNPFFGYQFDTYSFDEMRYINALIDYPLYKKTQQRVQRLFMKSPYELSIIQSNEKRGVLEVSPNLTTQYRIEISDFFGNTTKIEVPVVHKVSPVVVANETASPYFVKSKIESLFSKENISVFFPANTFYEDFNLNFDVKNDTLFLHSDTVPVHSSFSIEIEDQKFSPEQKNKLFIASIGSKKIGYTPTSRKDNVFKTNVKTLGKFALVLDTIPPKITISKPIQDKWLTKEKILQFTISDNLSGIKTYNGYLNGNWILFEYDNKTNKITHQFSDGIVAEGQNDLKIEVVDNVGNSVIFETRFFRSQKP